MVRSKVKLFGCFVFGEACMNNIYTIIELRTINVPLLTVDFYPNVTTLRLDTCYRKSVCLSSVCLSVCNVRAPYSIGQLKFSRIFLCHFVAYPSIDHHANLTKIVPGEPLSRLDVTDDSRQTELRRQIPERNVQV